MTEIVSGLMEANLLRVFNERDAERRASAIEEHLLPRTFAGRITRGPPWAVKRWRPRQ